MSGDRRGNPVTGAGEVAVEGACSASEDGMHCEHWFDCEPCHFCGFVGGGVGCDCPRHNPSLYDEHGNELPEVELLGRISEGTVDG